MEQKYNLAGHILVSPPQIIDRRFQNTVILVCGNNAGGSWGLAINRPMAHATMQDICQRISLPWTNTDPVYVGGPVDPHGLHIIHSSDIVCTESLQVADDIYVTNDVAFLQTIGTGVRPQWMRFTLGVCTWAPDQLEGEMTGQPPWTPEHRWLTAPAESDLIFNSDDSDQWQAAVNHCASYKIRDWMS